VIELAWHEPGLPGFVREDRDQVTSKALTAALIAFAITSFVVIGCSRLDSAATPAEESTELGEQLGELGDLGNARCVAGDDEMFCASSRLREPIRQASFSTL
jgi:hypothetical protein